MLSTRDSTEFKLKYNLEISDNDLSKNWNDFLSIADDYYKNLIF